MWINFIQLPILLIIDLFVFFFNKKIFFKFNKSASAGTLYNVTSVI